MGTFSWGSFFQEIAPTVVKGGLDLFTMNQIRQDTYDKANEAKSIEELRKERAQIEKERLELEILANSGKPPEKTKNNTALYIGLGVGGVALIGILIFAVTRK
jgi:hypothetical protein